MSIDPESVDLLGMADEFRNRAYTMNPPSRRSAKELSDLFLDHVLGMDVNLGDVDPQYWNGVGATLGLSDDQLGTWSERIRSACSGELS